MAAKKPPKRGDVIKVTWVDITEDPVGDPDKGIPIERVSFGMFWAQDERDGMDCLITTTTLDTDGHHQQGYCCYPLGCVVSVEVVKRARTRG